MELTVLVRQPSRWGRVAVLAPALTVAMAAVAATAHGGYEVAVACHVPPGIAWLYPLITDGLALVAYAATHRMRQLAARAYAWLVVVLAAALSGLAQAVYLASGPALDTSPVLRFGVGAWPAVAGAVAAHLVYLLARRPVVVSGGANLQHLVSLAPTVGLSGTPQTPAGTTPPDVPAGPTNDPVGEPANDPPLRKVADLVAVRAAHQRVTPTSPLETANPTTNATVGEPPTGPANGDVEARARALVKAGAGRDEVAAKLGIGPTKARRIVEEIRPPRPRQRRHQKATK